ncbi:MAG: FGGY family carbohydrate kinase [Phycisphaerae bacterium]
MLVLGVDIGTSSLKLGAVDVESGTLADWRHGDYEPQHPQLGWSELDAECYWQAFTASLNQLKIDRREVRAIAVSSQAQSFVPVDQEGRTLQNVWTWLDNRAALEASELNKTISHHDLFNATGLRDISPGLLPAMLKYLKNHHPRIVQRTWKYLFSSSYLIRQLCGQAVADENLAAMSGMYDWHRNVWWERMLGAVGIDSDQLPNVVPSGAVVGKILPKISHELGLSDDVLIVTGANDQTANALGAGLLNEKGVLIVLGSALVLYRVMDSDQVPTPSDTSGVWGPYPIRGTSYQLGYTNSGCGTVDWAKELLTPEIPYSDLFDRMAKVSAGSEGVTWLIDLDGVASFDNKEYRGTIAGLSRKTNRWTILRAAVEAVACSVRELTERMNWNLNGQEIRIAGGGARSDLWVQIHAEVLKTPVTCLDHEQSGVIGSCILAAVGANFLNGFKNAMEKMVRPGRLFKPDPSVGKQYQELYERFRRLRKTGNLFYK